MTSTALRLHCSVACIAYASVFFCFAPPRSSQLPGRCRLWPLAGADEQQSSFDASSLHSSHFPTPATQHDHAALPNSHSRSQPHPFPNRTAAQASHGETTTTKNTTTTTCISPPPLPPLPRPLPPPCPPPPTPVHPSLHRRGRPGDRRVLCCRGHGRG